MNNLSLSRKMRRAVFGLSLTLLALPGVARAQVSIYPVSDRTIAGAPTPNPWSTNDAKISIGSNGTYELRGLFKFSLDASSSEIASASSILLSFTAPTITDIGEIQLIHITTPSDNDTIAGGDYSVTGTVVATFDTASLSADTPFTFDVTSLVQADAASSITYSEFRLQAVTVPSTQRTFDVYAGQGNNIPANDAFRAQLTVIPEASTNALLLALGAGIVGLKISRRFRRR